MAPRDPWGAFRREAIAWTGEALHAAFGISETIDPLVEEPEAEIADFAVPCFELAGEIGPAPHDIAAEIEDAMPDPDRMQVEAEGPYLNFTVDRDVLAEATLGSVLDHGDAYGTHEATGKTVLLEHTSANPTGPLHMGRARNPLLADTLVRLLRAAGHQITAEYYVNDMGRQAAMLVWGAKNIDLDGDDRAKTADGDELFTYSVREEPVDASSSKVLAADDEKIDHLLVRYYQAFNDLLEAPEGDVDRDVEAEIADLIQAFEDGEDAIATEFREVIAHAMHGIRGTLERVNVHHDNVKHESEFVLDGSVEDVLERLKKLETCKQEDDGAWYLDTGELGQGDEKDQLFLTRSDGTTLYGTRDIAYHIDKFDRAEKLVNVLGEDHELHAREIQTALDALGVEGEIDVVFYNFVFAVEGSFSTREGNVVFLDDVLDEAEAQAYETVAESRGDELDEATLEEVAEQVGLGVVRFNTVDVQSRKAIEFTWDEALSFDGATAPFVQYSHARAHGILDKAGVEPGSTSPPDPGLLDHSSERALVRAIGRLPSVVLEGARERKAHRMTAYAVDLAQAFNDMYRDCPVLEAETSQLHLARLALVDATRQALANALELIGIEAPAEM
jgi:arginyl-tRNA synthetase